jgi:predicted acetyltransferase
LDRVRRWKGSRTVLQLVEPSKRYLAAYVAALERGYTPSTHDPKRGFEDLREIRSDERKFLKLLTDPFAKVGTSMKMADGSLVARLPGFVRWMWDGEFAGSISLRWQPGTAELPPTCLGHIGYSVVAWKRRRGYATTALRLMLPEARRQGLSSVDVVTEAGNIASQRVIEANGGTLVERFEMSRAHGGGEAIRYRIAL